jgi:exosortase
VFLAFMVPLPTALAGLLRQPLHHVATVCSTGLLQTIGLTAVSRGNVISLPQGQIGVVEACSGLRMLMLFLAITVGASFLIKRPLWEKLFVSMSALVIAVLTNVLRITVTAMLYEFAGPELAEKVFHDLAGWLMMPVAMLLLMLELYILSKLLVSPAESRPILMPR